MALSRLYDFTPGDTIRSAEVDSEFNQLIACLNGTSTDKNVIIKYSHATIPPLTLDQTGAGPGQVWKTSNVEVARVANSGQMTSAATATAADFVKLGGQYKQNVTLVGNVTAGEDNLHSYTLLANTFATVGDTLQIQGTGYILGAGNNKTLKFYFGTDLIFSLTVDPSVTKTWAMDINITRINSTEAMVTVLFYDNLLTSVSGSIVQSTVDFTATITTKWTGEDADGTSDRITQVSSFVRKFFAA